jgi:putative restriction endonuclease
MAKRIFGEILGIFEGQEFQNRLELSISGVHKPTQAGISGSQFEGADSIVISGGYEDDEDHGNIIIYTGHGGRDINSGKQVVDQGLYRQNLALTLNCQNGLPVRVIRGSAHKSDYSPDKGYRYDGLFRVENYWKEKGTSGHIVWRFRLVKIDPVTMVMDSQQSLYIPTVRKDTNIQRIIRNSDLAITVKAMYESRCQVCGYRIPTNAGYYSEAAHIKPLGIPHNGPDDLDNILCLCPNHHVMLDYGGFSILDNLALIGIEGRLEINAKHKLSLGFIKYHREHFYQDMI